MAADFTAEGAATSSSDLVLTPGTAGASGAVWTNERLTVSASAWQERLASLG